MRSSGVRGKRQEDKNWRNSAICERLSVASKYGGNSGGDALASELSLFAQDIVGLFQTVATIWLFAQRRVSRLGITYGASRCVAQLSFTDGVADANIHRTMTPASDSQLPIYANYSQ